MAKRVKKVSKELPSVGEDTPFARACIKRKSIVEQLTKLADEQSVRVADISTKTAALSTALDRIDIGLKEYLKSVRANSMSFGGVTVKAKPEEAFSIEDFQAFWDWARQSKDGWQYFKKQVIQAVMDEHLEKTKQLPPGIVKTEWVEYTVKQ